MAEERLRSAPWAAAYATRRPYVVAPSLEELKGPVSGVVRLPQRLDWSGDPVYDLNKPGNLLAMYQVVLNEATHVDELRQWLNGSALIALWPKLWIPAAVRNPWEARYPQLSSATRSPIGAVARCSPQVSTRSSRPTAITDTPSRLISNWTPSLACS